MHVKICGLRRPEDAIAAALAGADFLGMVFAPSRRQIDAAIGREIVQAVRGVMAGHPPMPAFVGVYVDEDLLAVNAMVRDVGLDYVQLAGSESGGYASGVSVPVIQVHRLTKLAAIQQALDAQRFLEQVRPGSLALVDSHHGAGGSGKVADWEIAAAAARQLDFLLAGGLTPENVGDAIRQVRPWGIDVSSGVETDGAKDPARIVAFVHAALGAVRLAR